MQDKKHLEYKVTEWDSQAKTKIIRKELTKRGSVMISERDARTNNLQTSATGLFYELAEEKKESKNGGNPELRKVLEAKAVELGIKFKDNIGDVKLLAKINEIEPEFKTE